MCGEELCEGDSPGICAECEDMYCVECGEELALYEESVCHECEYGSARGGGYSMTEEEPGWAKDNAKVPRYANDAEFTELRTETIEQLKTALTSAYGLRGMPIEDRDAIYYGLDWQGVGIEVTVLKYLAFQSYSVELTTPALTMSAACYSVDSVITTIAALQLAYTALSPLEKENTYTPWGA